MTNNRTNIEAEQLLVVVEGMQTVDHEMDIYYYRKEQDSALVKVYGA